MSKVRVHFRFLVATLLLATAAWGDARAETDDETGFRSLYNGRDFTGWEGPTHAWEAADGTLNPQPGRGGTVFTTDQFADFIVRLQYRLPPGGNNGLAIRYPGKGDGAYLGMCEIQILDDDFPKYANFDGRKFTGAAYNMVAPERGHQNPAGEWNDMEVRVEGSTIQVTLNGHKILDSDLNNVTEFVADKPHPGKHRKFGHFGLCGHGHAVEFRNIRVKELKTIGELESVSADASADGIAEAKKEGWRPLFNGVDLTGWKVPEGDNGHWQVVGGVIDYDAQSESPKSKNLWTIEKFGDFELRLGWRLKESKGDHAMPNILPSGDYERDAKGKLITTLAPNADSGVLLRGYGKAQINIWCWPCGSGEVYGYRSDTKQPPEIRQACVPLMRADRPLGEWNEFYITLRGDVLNIELNGKHVIRDAKLPGIPPLGPIGLQHHGGIKQGKWSTASSLVQFRDIWIRDLSNMDLSQSNSEVHP